MNWNVYGHCITRIYGEPRAILTGGETSGTKTLIMNNLDQEWDHTMGPPDFNMENGNEMQGRQRQCSQSLSYKNIGAYVTIIFALGLYILFMVPPVFGQL